MTEPVEVAVGGVHWLVMPEWRDRLLGPEGLRLDDWLRTGQARVIKNGPHRTVYRVAAPGVDVYLKHYRLMDLRAWLRELVRPAKALREYRQALAIGARDIPTVEPVAVGRAQGGFGPADSFLVTQSLAGTVALNTFLEIRVPRLHPREQTRVRQLLATALARFLARLHDSGVSHQDLHAGNVLVRRRHDGRFELFLIDLHAARLGRPLTWPARLANLIIFNRYFSMRASRSDRLRFWQAYCLASGGRLPPEYTRDSAAPTVLQLAGELEARTWASNLRFWKERDGRCLGSNRYYQRVRSRLATGYAVSDLEPAALAPLLADPDAPFHLLDAAVLKNSRSSTVVEFALSMNGQTRRVIYKRFRSTSRIEPFLSLVRRPPALRSWINGQGLRERAVPTPRPLAVLHRRRFGLLGEGYLLQEKIPDTVDLHGFVRSLNGLPPVQQRQLLRGCVEAAARLIRGLHDRQLSHRDLKGTNILVAGYPGLAPEGSGLAPAFALWLIDLVGLARYRQLPHPRKIQNLARLHASFWHSSQITRTDKLRFLRTYLQWGLRGKSGWKEWWRQIEEATQAKIARNRRRGRPLG
jgi:tRNA A-37 threonylcarbamoyl transferase component Bud32